MKNIEWVQKFSSKMECSFVNAFQCGWEVFMNLICLFVVYLYSNFRKYTCTAIMLLRFIIKSLVLKMKYLLTVYLHRSTREFRYIMVQENSLWHILMMTWYLKYYKITEVLYNMFSLENGVHSSFFKNTLEISDTELTKIDNCC